MKVPKGASGNEAEKEQSLMRSTSMQKKYVLLWASSALLILDVQREICGETQGNRWPTTFSTVRTQLDIADATYLIADVQAFKPHSARAQVRKLKRMIWSRLLSVNSTSSSKLHDRRVGITLPSEDTVRISGEDEGYHSAVTDVGDVDMHQDHADEADDEETENINDDVDENGNLLGFIDDEEIEWSESNDSNGDAMPGEESDVAASALRAADTRRHGSRKASDRRYAVHLLTLPWSHLHGKIARSQKALLVKVYGKQ